MVSFLNGTTSLYFDESIQPLFFLKPSNPADGPTRDSVIDGILVFKTARARDVKEITVELTGKQTMWIAGRHESYETLKRSITLNPGYLEAGEHRFGWSMIVPANTAPYEACMFGKTGHALKATAVGCGRFGKDLIAYSEVDLTADPNDPGIAPGFDRSREIFHPILGSLRGRFFTKYLLRGGYIRFALKMPAIGQPVIIEDVQTVLVQNFNLQSMKNPKLVEHVSVDIPLWSLKKEGIAPLKLRDGEDLSLVRLVRLMAEGQHEMVRPTSNDWSETGIRLAHQIMIVIRFRPLEDNPTGETKEMKIPFEAKLSSCASSVENMQLPDYETVSANVKSFRSTTQGWRMACLCHRPTTAELEAVYGSDLKADKEDEYGHENNRQPPWALKEALEASTP